MHVKTFFVHELYIPKPFFWYTEINTSIDLPYERFLNSHIDFMRILLSITAQNVDSTVQDFETKSNPLS